MKQMILNKQWFSQVYGRRLLLLGLFLFTMIAAQAAPPTPEVRVYNGSTLVGTYDFTNGISYQHILYDLTFATKIVATGTWNNNQLGGLRNAIHNHPEWAGHIPPNTSLQEADLSAITVSGNIPDGFGHMFEKCRNLTTVIFPQNYTNHVVSFARIFFQCYKLTTVVNLEKFNQVNSFNTSFEDCLSLETITLPSTSGQNINFYKAFYTCPVLTTISSLANFAHITTFDQTFAHCSTLPEITLPLTPHNEAISFRLAFRGCDGLIGSTSNVIHNFTRFTNVNSFEGTFMECGRLTEIVLPPGSIATYVDFTSAFSRSNELRGKTTDVIKNFTAFTNVSKFIMTFNGCENLTEITLPNGTTYPEISFKEAFKGCTRLNNIVNLKSFTNNVNMDQAFLNCTQLTYVYLDAKPNNTFKDVFYATTGTGDFDGLCANPNMLIYLHENIPSDWIPKADAPKEDPFVIYVRILNFGFGPEVFLQGGFSDVNFRKVFYYINDWITIDGISARDIGWNYYTYYRDLLKSFGPSDRYGAIDADFFLGEEGPMTYGIELRDMIRTIATDIVPAYNAPVPYFHCNIITNYNRADRKSLGNIELVDRVFDQVLDSLNKMKDVTLSCPYHCPLSFGLPTGATVRLTRNFAGQLSTDDRNGWQTLITPFNVATIEGPTPFIDCHGQSDKGYSIAEYIGSKSGTGVIDINIVDNIVVDNPYFVMFKASAFNDPNNADVRFISAPGITVPATKANLTTNDVTGAFTFTGSFRQIPNTANTAYYLNGSAIDTLTKGSPVNILGSPNRGHTLGYVKLSSKLAPYEYGLPFRAHFVAESGAPAVANLTLVKNKIPPCYGTRYYVKEGGAGDHSGLNWANASPDLQAMMDLAYAAGGDTVFVAAGTYKPERIITDYAGNVMTTDNEGNLTTDRDFVFMLRAGVKVYGGFPTDANDTDHDNINARDWNTNKTILSGDIGELNDISDNCYHVVLWVGDADEEVLLDGFNITGGNANGPSYFLVPTPSSAQNPNSTIHQKHGGGLYIWGNGSKVIFTNLDVYDNNTTTNDGTTAEGGGAFITAKTYLTFTNSVIRDNNAQSNGGGIYGGPNCIIDLKNAIITGNKAGRGGGVYSHLWNNPDRDSKFALINVLISDNEAAYQGSGLYVGNNNKDVTLTNVTIAGNRSALTSVQGAGLYTYFIGTSELECNNTIIALNENANGICNTYNNDATISVIYNNTLVQGGVDGVSDGIISTADPLFVAPENGNYQLSPCSPALNVGDNDVVNDLGITTDLNNEQRIYGTTVDLGAYEYQGEAINPTKLYVNINVSGGDESGSSWENAMPELADALELARMCPSITDIWVAAGTYYPKYDLYGANAAQNGDPRMATFQLPKNVNIYGGFKGDETSLDQRQNVNPLHGERLYVSILSGDIDHDTDPDDYTDSEEIVVSDELKYRKYLGTSGNAHNIVVSKEDVGTTIFDGFTIQGALSNFWPVIDENTNLEELYKKMHANLGAFLIYDNSFPKLSNLEIINNSGITISAMLYTSKTLIEMQEIDFSTTPLQANNIAFRNNISGIMNIWALGYLDMANFDITGNRTEVNAEPNGTLVSGGRLSLRNGKITDNISYSSALVHFHEIEEPSYTLTNVTISNNKLTEGEGLAIYGNKQLTSPIEGYINNCIITGNTHGYEEPDANRMIQRGYFVEGERNVWYRYPSKNYVQNSWIRGSLGSGANWVPECGADRGGNVDTQDELGAPIDAFVNEGPFPYQLSPTSLAVDAGDVTLYNIVGDAANDLDLAGNPRVYPIGTESIDMGAYEYFVDGVTVNLTVFLYGPMNQTGTAMTNYIQTADPENSGFSTPSLPKINPYGRKDASNNDIQYSDINNVNGPAGAVVDWIRVDIREAVTFNLLESKALLLKPDGTIVDTDGAPPTFGEQSGPVHIAIRHRNHIAVVSTVIDDFSGTVSHDFSTGLSKAYVSEYGETPMIQRSGGKWCMWAGDVEKDEMLDAVDQNVVTAAAQAGDFGKYDGHDANLDGFIDAVDQNIVYYAAREGAFSIVYEWED